MLIPELDKWTHCGSHALDSYSVTVEQVNILTKRIHGFQFDSLSQSAKQYNISQYAYKGQAMAQALSYYNHSAVEAYIDLLAASHNHRENATRSERTELFFWFCLAVLQPAFDAAIFPTAKSLSDCSGRQVASLAETLCVELHFGQDHNVNIRQWLEGKVVYLDIDPICFSSPQMVPECLSQWTLHQYDANTSYVEKSYGRLHWYVVPKDPFVTES